MALAMLGQHDQAVACAELTQREFVAQGDVRAASKVSLNLGSLHFGRDAYAQAARHYREAAVLFARVADHEHSVMADIGLGDALTAQGEFEDALLMYARARMRAGTHGFPVLQAMVEESCALLYLTRGAYRDALGGFERSRHGYEQLAMPRHLAIAEKQLADAYLELRLLPEALTLYEQAIARFGELDAPGELAWALAQHGRTQALLERPDRAQESLRRAAALFHDQGAAIGEAAVALVRSELALAIGNAEEALALASTASEAFEQAGMAERLAKAQVLRARAVLAQGQPAAAAALFDSQELRARSLGLLSIRVQCLTGRGLCRAGAGRQHAGARRFQGRCRTVRRADARAPRRRIPARLPDRTTSSLRGAAAPGPRRPCAQRRRQRCARRARMAGALPRALAGRANRQSVRARGRCRHQARSVCV